MTDTTAARAHRLAPGYGYLLAGLPLGIVAFVVAVAGFSVGIGTLVVWIGVPVLVATLVAARGLAAAERALVAAATGRELPPHHYREPDRFLGRLTDPQPWRDLLHAVVAFPLRVAAFSIALVWGVGGLGALLSVTWMWALPRGDSTQLFELITGVDSLAAEVVLQTLLGAGMLLTLPLVVRGLVAVLAGLARLLLTNETAALRARATALETSRRAAVDAEAQTLRRLERDLHDGPQQRLVRLGMDLEAVTRRLDDDPERARPLVAEALVQSREALAELRALSRGIAPPILVDRGLQAALTALAGRSIVPVDLDAQQVNRLEPAVESNSFEFLRNYVRFAGAVTFQIEVGAPHALRERHGLVSRPIDPRDVPPGRLVMGQLRGRALPVAAAKFADRLGRRLEAGALAPGGSGDAAGP